MNCGEQNPKACKICRRCRYDLRPWPDEQAALYSEKSNATRHVSARSDDNVDVIVGKEGK